ncbi:Uncharacterised protein [Burkholderia pseudomallei]|nr:hypothetical protein BBJ_3786 [Burkholderia pseudomallei NCTC 13178]KGX57828.1 hypothetical protein Y024_772 [Burkholderia pseudomallei TSV44]CAJ9684891.1 Uncharacterised protein [Burkholderia pseudomallei]
MPASARAGPVSAARRATGVGPCASRTMPVVPGAAPWKHGPAMHGGCRRCAESSPESTANVPGGGVTANCRSRDGARRFVDIGRV